MSGFLANFFNFCGLIFLYFVFRSEEDEGGGGAGVAVLLLLLQQPALQGPAELQAAAHPGGPQHGGLQCQARQTR